MSVLVTVTAGSAALDLDLDDHVPIRDLLPEIAAAFGHRTGIGLAHADGRPLDAGSTLAAAGILDGHRLTMSPGSVAPNAEGGPPVLPCYLAVDTSDSMAGPALDAVNVELGRLVDALHDDPRVSDGCRLAVVRFDADAHIVLPLSPVSGLDQAPRLSATRPATNYECVFRLLRRQIGRDLDGLRMAGLRPLRPTVVVVTDGRPTRGYWPPAHAALTDPGWDGAPEVLAFGFGDAAELTIRRVGTAGAYLAAPLVGPSGPARRGAAEAPSPAVTARLVASVMTFVLDALGHPSAGLQIPAEPPDGWRSLDGVVR